MSSLRSMLSTTTTRHFLAHCRMQWQRIRNFGVLGLLQRIFKKVSLWCLSIVFLPLSVIVYACGIRRLMIFSDRIGHLAIEPDTLLKAQTLGWIKPKRWLILAPPHRVANHHLLSYWAPHFYMVQKPWACFLWQALTHWPWTRYDVAYFINSNQGSQFAYRVNAQWGDRPPVLTLRPEDRLWGDQQLEAMGVPAGAWFVAIHVREGGFSPIDEALHAHRNGSIAHLVPAIEAITARGGYVIRLGDPTMVPLMPMKQVIDYAHHPARCERLDVYLCATARFIIGNTSGLFILGSIFGVPSALANMIPIPTLGFLPQDISMPKLLFSQDLGRNLSFPEIMSSPVAEFRCASLYADHHLIPIENSADEILNMTLEMFASLENSETVSDDDESLHSQYLALLQPQHYSYGAASRISLGFLHKYRALL